ncbi:MAG: DUF86 domain-containing protein [Acidobacteria bacterium]|nr:DUF86 domain-containing protein [Acidobacteriota bacterium]
MRRDEQFLADIVAACDWIASRVAALDFDSFFGDEELSHSVLYKLITIGEACARLSPDLRSQYAEIPWADIVSFRNIVVHNYFGVDWAEVWTTASQEVSPLRNQIAAVLVSEFPQGPLE